MGLSQQAVADKAGLSRIGYRDIEIGKAAPRFASLQRIADALGVPIPELLSPVRELTHVRFRADKKMATRGNILVDVARWLDDYEEVEEVLDKTEDWHLAQVAATLRRSRRTGVALGKHAAGLAREALGLGSDVIRDMCGLLEDSGVKLVTASVASEGFYGLSVGVGDGGPAVFVNVWDRISVERWIFTAAHELGHLLLHPDAYDVSRTDEADREQAEADAFAGHFIMPDDVFAKEWSEARGLGIVDRVFKVKRMFGVSWQTVLYRIASGRPKSERREIWQRFNDAYEREHGQPLTRQAEPAALDPEEFGGRPTPRAADEPSRFMEDDFHEDRLSRLVREAVEIEAISLSRAAEILRLDMAKMRDLANAWVE